ncbi:Ethanolamine-phosphate cytidylyltransferase [Hibiscus syriacus]|uniref:ethanolamine-phosphate cytidylyltransferase n=1 Tax=Hibiscus syriacus TaxID=106335 RepID=A0A6A2YIS0_HIBSY|nr:ethanolamine-phosphate cytidylyltransferase-like [Hibiscus syriacus]XP_039030693.1 ethanolamine-phosphate cytidylyltransferase-like [Hibiscus syriacus]KAE8676637.1 Ethanolamine-phosphate cytidylyltransferase [Hibiscus syriacus]
MPMEYESNNWVWDWLYSSTHLFGGLMVTAALLGFSTSYFGGIGVFPSYGLSNFGIFLKKKRERKRIRVYMDGCFDLMHYGHANALRQAKALGDELVVGVVSDEEIVANKGPPVLSMEERLALVSGLKWVDQVIANAPYAITEKFMNTLFNEYKIDYIIHGDDPCLLPDGTDAYALAKKAGRYKQIKRTEGVSSTDIVGRILSSMKNNKSSKGDSGKSQQLQRGQLSQFLPTSRRIVQFSNGKGPGPNARIVYIDGAFDLFHAGHVEILKKARQLGDFLLVGIHADHIVSEQRGIPYPVMHLLERTLSVLACRYVDEVIIGAPWGVSKDMTTTFNISLVVHGTISESNTLLPNETDPFAVPKDIGIFRMLESPKIITTSSVAQRIVANHVPYMKRNAKKTQSEKKYYEEKAYVAGD